jgi:hypothetical protein
MMTGPPAAVAGELTVEALLELSGEDSPAAATTLVARSLGLLEVGAAFAPFVSLEVLSLSDNQLTSLAECGNMPQLSSLNVNSNRITSLAPLARCPQLTHLFAANNKLSSIAPLATCQRLTTLSLYKNQIPSLDSALATLSRLPALTELDLASNPCALGPPYRHRLVSTLSSLRTLDGEEHREQRLGIGRGRLCGEGGGLGVDPSRGSARYPRSYPRAPRSLAHLGTAPMPCPLLA